MSPLQHLLIVDNVSCLRYKKKLFVYSSIVCNENVQCRTFDYDSHSLICRLFEGAVETGQIVSSGSLTSCVGSVRLESKFFAAFGQPCVQCTNSRYLVCSSSNNTCECPKDTFWDGVQCKNQGYEDANCSSNQCCRQDAGFNCSKLHFCTGKTECSSYRFTSTKLNQSVAVIFLTIDFGSFRNLFWCRFHLCTKWL